MISQILENSMISILMPDSARSNKIINQQIKRFDRANATISTRKKTVYCPSFLYLWRQMMASILCFRQNSIFNQTIVHFIFFSKSKTATTHNASIVGLVGCRDNQKKEKLSIKDWGFHDIDSVCTLFSFYSISI